MSWGRQKENKKVELSQDFGMDTYLGKVIARLWVLQLGGELVP